MKVNEREKYDIAVQELIVSMLILKGSNHERARVELEQQYSLGTMTNDKYPNTEEKVISLLDTFARNKNNNNNNDNNNNEGDAVVAAHAIEQDCYSDHDDDDDDDDSYTESNLSTDDVEEAYEATLPDNLEEAPGTEDSEDFKATILANAVAEYDSELLEVENNFINRTNMNINQDLSDAFEENEPDALACAHMVVFEDNDDFVVVDEINDNNNISIRANDNNNISIKSHDDNNISIINDNNNISIRAGDDNNISIKFKSHDDNNISISDTTTNGYNNGTIRGSSAPRLSPIEEELQVTRDTITAVYAVAVIKFEDQSHTINNIIEYADALLFKLSTVRINSATQLHSAVEHGSEYINNKLTSAGHSKLQQDTVDLLRKESWKSSCFTERQSLRAYNATITMIGDDDDINFPDQSGIRVFIEATATLQRRRAPIRWTNNVTHKLISCGISSKWRLRETIQDGTLNDIIAGKGKPRFNKITISGIATTMNPDFH